MPSSSNSTRSLSGFNPNAPCQLGHILDQETLRAACVWAASVSHCFSCIVSGTARPPTAMASFFAEPWVGGGAHDVVERRKVGEVPPLIEQRVVLPVGIRVADQVMQI